MSSLVAQLIGEAQKLGFVGPVAIEQALDHARGFADGAAEPPASFVDLGSGGGLPGLVLAELWPDATAFLVESSAKRCSFLRDAVDQLGLSARVVVVQERAETVGRDTEHRLVHDVVVARGFSAPAVTAECAAPLLAVGGRLVVSEPPKPDPDRARWPADGLAELGMALDRAYVTPFHYQVIMQAERCPDRYPRHIGVPTKRPLF